jgi:hypothetical protein
MGFNNETGYPGADQLESAGLFSMELKSAVSNPACTSESTTSRKGILIEARLPKK